VLKKALFAIALLAVVSVFVVFALAVIEPTQDNLGGANVVEDAVDAVSSLDDGVNDVLENSPVGEAFAALDEATN
jgi:hypothetical protein